MANAPLPPIVLDDLAFSSVTSYAPGFAQPTRPLPGGGFNPSVLNLAARAVLLAIEQWSQYGATQPPLPSIDLPFLSAGFRFTQPSYFTVAEPPPFGNTPHPLFGFLATCPEYSVLAFRGTETTYEETEIDPYAGTPVNCDLGKNGATVGQVGYGPYWLYTSQPDPNTPSLQAQVRASLSAAQSGILVVTGHSLGALVAALCAFDLSANGLWDPESMPVYRFASPRASGGTTEAGASVFAAAYNKAVPFSYRVTNLADSIPLFPSSDALGAYFAHLEPDGRELTFLSQTGAVTENHFMERYQAFAQYVEDRRLPPK